MHEDPNQKESFWRRWAVLAILGGVLLVVTIVQPYSNGPAIRSDGVGYHMWTYAFLKGDLHFRWIPIEEKDDYRLLNPDPSRIRYGCWYPPGVALLRLPVMAFLAHPKQARMPFSDEEHLACLTCSALAFLGTVWLTLRACRRLGASWFGATAAVLMLTFGTGLFHYATYDGSFSHVYSALGAACILMLAVHAVQGREGYLPALPTVLILILLLLIRNTNIFLITFWLVGLFVWGWWGLNLRSRRCWVHNALVVTCGIALGTGTQLAINWDTFGRFQLNSYDTGFDFSRSMLPEVLFSWDRGLFLYYPIIGLALAIGVVVQRTRLLTAGLCLLILAYASLYGFWESWYLGAGFGHRGFVDIVPLLAPSLALGFTHLGRWTRTPALAAGTLCTAVTVSIMIGYWNGTFPFEKATDETYFKTITLNQY